MNKLIFFIILINIATECFAQMIKFGDISVDQKLAKEYFADLYTHPDTIIEKSYEDYLGNNGYYTREEYNEAKLKAAEFNKNLEKFNLGIFIDSTCIHTHNFSIKYIMPRKPSEEDFVRWYMKYKEKCK